MTTIHVGDDGARFEIFARGDERVCVISGRDAGRKVKRLRAAGFSWQRAGRANDVADVTLPGEWVSDGLPLVECAASSAVAATALIALARGH